MVAFAVALVVGIIAGLRAMTGAAAAAWAAYLALLPVTGTWLAWLASPWAVGIVTVFAVVELVTDQLRHLVRDRNAHDRTYASELVA